MHYAHFSPSSGGSERGVPRPPHHPAGSLRSSRRWAGGVARSACSVCQQCPGNLFIVIFICCCLAAATAAAHSRFRLSCARWRFARHAPKRVWQRRRQQPRRSGFAVGGCSCGVAASAGASDRARVFEPGRANLGGLQMERRGPSDRTSLCECPGSKTQGPGRVVCVCCAPRPWR